MKILVWLDCYYLTDKCKHKGGIIHTVFTDSEEEIEFKVMDFDSDSVEEDKLIDIKARDGREYKVRIDMPYTINKKEIFNYYWNQIEKSKKKLRKKVKK